MPAALRAEIEDRFYARVNEATRIENSRADPALWGEPTHLTWFSDHGVVHMRDVAAQVLRVLDTIHGVLIPARPARRFDPFMKTCGVLLAYLHDIGMADVSAYGRAIHPFAAAHAVFDGTLDGWIEAAWDENCGNIPWRLVGLERRGLLAQPPQVVFREILALSLAHSKSCAPPAILNDRAALRRHVLHALSAPLPQLYTERTGRTAPPEAAAAPACGAPASGAPASGPYAGQPAEAFAWLVAGEGEAAELADDVVDTLRALRCADGLRQRGTLQKTSAGYEVFVSLESGYATFGVRLGAERLYLLEFPEPFSAGEANLASSELTREGHLRIAFHRGAFASEAAQRRAVRAAALTVNDMQSDVLESFLAAIPERAGAATRAILLEATDDNPAFVDQVIAALIASNPELAGRLQRVPSLGGAALAESARYLAGRALNLDAGQRQALLDRLHEAGQRIEGLDPEAAFAHVRLATVAAGERLIEARTPAGFVYVPLAKGLLIAPLGGYQTFAVRPFMPLGATGVIRGAMRNADVFAEAPVEVVIIPKEIYLHHWHKPYTPAELAALLQSGE